MLNLAEHSIPPTIEYLRRYVSGDQLVDEHPVSIFSFQRSSTAEKAKFPLRYLNTLRPKQQIARKLIHFIIEMCTYSSRILLNHMQLFECRGLARGIINLVSTVSFLLCFHIIY